jgi:hypothetical protein
MATGRPARIIHELSATEVAPIAGVEPPGNLQQYQRHKDTKALVATVGTGASGPRLNVCSNLDTRIPGTHMTSRLFIFCRTLQRSYNCLIHHENGQSQRGGASVCLFPLMFD